MRIALAQLDCLLGAVDENVRRAREAVAEARAGGADLVVFPELRLSGYALAAAEHDTSCTAFEAAALAVGVAVLVGFHERDARAQVRRRRLDGERLAALEPAPDRRTVVTGLHARIDRYVRPEDLVARLAERLRSEDVRVVEGCEFQHLERRSGEWVLSTTTGDMAAERVVVAAGLQTDRLLRGLSTRLRMQPARGYSVTIVGSRTPPRHALYLAEARIGQSPYDHAVRIAGVFELGASRAEAPRRAGEKLLAAAGPYLSGWGELPGQPGLYVAAGHGILGVTLAPAAAALLVPLVLHGRVAPELAPFDPARRL